MYRHPQAVQERWHRQTAIKIEISDICFIFFLKLLNFVNIRSTTDILDHNPIHLNPNTKKKKNRHILRSVCHVSRYDYKPSGTTGQKYV